MKKELVCPECGYFMEKRKLLPPGRYKIKEGWSVAIRRCQLCCKDIHAGDLCLAVTTWTNLDGDGYHRWEDRYIEIRGRA